MWAFSLFIRNILVEIFIFVNYSVKMYNFLMKIRDEIKMLLAKRCTTMTQLAEAMTKKTKSNYTVKSISGKLSRGTVKFEEVRAMLDILGFDIEYKERL